MNKNQKFIVAGVILVIGIILTSQLLSKNNNEINIGGLYPMTGGLSIYGELSDKSAKLAIDKINQEGGIGGKKLNLIVQDHKCDTKTALSAFKQLHESQNVDFFVSAACSGTVIGLASETEGSVLIASAATSPKISGVSKNIFRNYASDETESKLFAKYILDNGYKNVGMIYEETDYAKGIVLNTEKQLIEKSDIKISKEGFAANSTDIKTQVTKTKSQNPDVVIISVQTTNTGEVILSEMEKQNYIPKKLIVNENILKSKDLMNKHKNLLNNSISADYVISNDSKTQDFLKEYKNKYGTDCTQINVCLTAYDNIIILANSIKTNGNNIEQNRNYISQNTFQGISGETSFDSKNDRKNTDYTLFEISNGESKILK